MKKLLFIIIFALNWVSISQAKVIDLYCEFIEGKAEQKDEIENYSITDYTVHQKFSEHFRGVRVKIDITKKKYLKYQMRIFHQKILKQFLIMMKYGFIGKN